MNIEEPNLDGVDRIFLDISMELFDEFNETLCNINDHLGDIYSYKDLEDVEKAQSEKEIKLLRQAVEIQQLKIDKQDKIINAMAEDMLCYLDNTIFTYLDTSTFLLGLLVTAKKVNSVEELKQYYEKKVSEGNETRKRKG